MIYRGYYIYVSEKDGVCIKHKGVTIYRRCGTQNTAVAMIDLLEGPA